MSRDNRPLSEQIYEAWTTYADALAAAQLLEEGKSAYVAQSMSRLGDIAVSRAERETKASPEYANYIKKMVAARQHANKIKARVEYLKALLTEWQSDQANHRMGSRA